MVGMGGWMGGWMGLFFWLGGCGGGGIGFVTVTMLAQVFRKWSLCRRMCSTFMVAHMTVWCRSLSGKNLCWGIFFCCSDLLTFISLGFSCLEFWQKIARGLQCVLWESLWSCGCVEACGTGTPVRRRTCSGGTQQNHLISTHIWYRPYRVRILRVPTFGCWTMVIFHAWNSKLSPLILNQGLEPYSGHQPPVGATLVANLTREGSPDGRFLKKILEDLCWDIETWSKMPSCLVLGAFRLSENVEYGVTRSGYSGKSAETTERMYRMYDVFIIPNSETP